ncbi:sensor histidine kinase [Streptomyces sp. NBC_01187]|uniref:sensor histidine kinase n=1 Tax=Streptomyces sp. NBC_01187 TaxID=2903766 RepID=UPI003862DB2F|nr:sensor domain-containing protein [Streptomyces sp. NBC_01187]
MASAPTIQRRPLALLLLRAPVSRWAAREMLYVLSGFPLAVIAFTWSFGALGLGALLLITFLGIPVLAVGLAGCRALGQLERGRARALLGLKVGEPEPVRALQRSRGPMAWVGALLRSGVSWRHLVYTLIRLPWALVSFIVALALWCWGWALLLYPLWQWLFPRYMDRPALQIGREGFTIASPGYKGAWVPDGPVEVLVVSVGGLLLTLLTPWVVRGLVQVDKLLVSGLLGPSSLAARVWELESDRGVVVDTAAADLRRIERDLHDGAQARLVSLAMGLGLAKEKLHEDPHTAAQMVDHAHDEAKIALQELRDLARGIHPAILTDRGLGPALSTLTARCTTPVTLNTDLTQRPAPAIEGIAYCTASELLQNLTKHSQAPHATLDIWRTPHHLLLQIHDQGKGGATPRPGSGLTGLADRLNAVDGLLIINSPPGGPTTITAQLPWR